MTPIKSALHNGGPLVTSADKTINYKQLYFEIIDTMEGMLNDSKISKAFLFLIFPTPDVLEMKGTIRKNDLLKETYEPPFDTPMLESQLTFIYMDSDFHMYGNMEVFQHGNFRVYFST
jgi:hypothetical protein